MKRLEYLYPEVISGYFKDENRKKEHYRYLQLPILHVDSLKRDIQAGAVKYEALEKLNGAPKSQYLLIDCDAYEDGLMAIGYLEALQNGRCEDVEEDVMPHPEEHYPEEYYEPWYMDAQNLPIISIREMLEFDDSDSMNGLPFYNMQMQTVSQRERTTPYWLDYASDIGRICVLCSTFSNPYCGSGEGVLTEPGLRSLERLKEYETVYIVRSRTRQSGFGSMGFDPRMSVDTEELPDTLQCRLLFDYDAEHVSVGADKEKEQKYRRMVFDNLLRRYQKRVGKNFPKNKIIEMIAKIDLNYPNVNMEKAFRYIDKRFPSGSLKEAYFKNLGVLAEDRTDRQEDGEETLGDLIGMESVKQRIEEIVRTMKYKQCRISMGMKATNYRNVFLMLGAPGTAKTTIARILGRRFAKERLLGGTRFISLNGAELKGMFVGHTAPHIHDIFEENDIIFIDEAYSIAASDRGHLDPFSQEALAQLAIELENHGTDRLIIFAGYGGKDVTDKNNKMREFLDANPGIKSRINGTIYFSSYSPQEMVAIVHGIASQMEFVFEENVDRPICEYFAGRVMDKNFGNGREARSFVENCQQQLAERVMQIPESERTKSRMITITREDVEAAIGRCREENRMQKGGKQAEKYGLI